jgi:hypothetical protein
MERHSQRIVSEKSIAYSLFAYEMHLHVSSRLIYANCRAALIQNRSSIFHKRLHYLRAVAII